MKIETLSGQAVCHTSAQEAAAQKTLKHLAIIPDGNRRWARLRGVPRAEGHRHGFLEAALAVIDQAFWRNVQTVTLWMLSQDNWGREPEELSDLMDIYGAFLAKIRSKIELDPSFQRVGVSVIGRRDRIAPQLMADAARLCADYPAFTDGPHLILALDYGGRRCMMDEVRQLIDTHAVGQAVAEADLLRALNGHDIDMPEVDMVLRTSGEQRLSGFMPLQSARAELLFLDKLFPDLNPNDIDQAVDAFASRQHRRGC